MDSPAYSTCESNMEALSISSTSRGSTLSGASSPRSSVVAVASPSLYAEYSKLALRAATFGLELEFILAFNEDILKLILAKYNIDADIDKSPKDFERRAFMSTTFVGEYPTYRCRARYPSWALQVPETDLTRRKRLDADMFCNKLENGRTWIRRLLMEPLLIAKECLNSNGLDLNVVGWMGCVPDEPDNLHASTIAFPTEDSIDEAVMLIKADVDYSKWTLANDHSLLGMLRSQLQQHLKSQDVSEDSFADWDTYGMELVTPVFELQKKKEAFAEIEQYLKALSGERTSALESVWCGVHVHIGWDIKNPEDIPVRSFQHLAYILILHEDLVSKCHPRSRSGVALPKRVPEASDVGDTDDAEEFDPNRPWEAPPAPTEAELERDEERMVLAFEAEYSGAYPGEENLLSNARYLRTQLAHQLPPLADLAMEHAIFKQDGTIFDLIRILQHGTDAGPYKAYLYNFGNLFNLARNKKSWKPIKPTVEFRQHACTLDPVVLEHWVTLLEAIVRKAEEKASERVSDFMMQKEFAEREATKYPTTMNSAPWPYQNMRRFCTEFLGLNIEEGGYWQGRFENYKDDRPEYNSD